MYVFICRAKELREKKNKKRGSESSSHDTTTTEGESDKVSDLDDNEDLPDYKENGYHPVHIGYAKTNY